MLKRGLSLFLSIIMVFSLLPLQAFAAENSTEPTEIVLETEATEETTEATTEPETTEAETEPEVTEPEVTEPEVTEPEVTEPEATEPEVTEPEVTEPKVTEPEATEPESGITTYPTREDWTPQEVPSYYVEVRPETLTRTEEIRDLKVDEQGHYYYETFTETYETEMYVREEIMTAPISTFAWREQYGQYYFSTFEDLQELASCSYDSRTYVYYEGEGPLVISESLTMPANLILRFGADNSELVIDKDVTFETCYDEDYGFFVDKLEINGTFINHGFSRVFEKLTLSGTLYLYDNFYLEPDAQLDKTGTVRTHDEWVRFVRDYHAYDMEELKDVIDLVKADKNNGLEFDVTVYTPDDADFYLTESVNLPAKARFDIFGERPFVINEGVTLTLNADYNFFMADCVVNGKLVVNGELALDADGENRLVFSETGNFGGDGFISVVAYDWQDRIVKLENTKANLWVEWYGDYEQIPRWKVVDVTGKTQLTTPFDLTWHQAVEIYGDWNEKTQTFKPTDYKTFTSMGETAWRAEQPHQGHFDIQISHKDENGNIFQQGTSWRFDIRNAVTDWYSTDDFVMNDPEDGTYWFEVSSLADGNKYYSSPYSMKSPEFEYTKPEKTLGTATNLRWEAAEWGPGFGASWKHPVGTKDGGKYEVEFYFAPTKDAEPEHVGSSWGTYWQDDPWTPWDEMVQDCGAGYYYFRVRAISQDITKIYNGEWSELSEAYCLGVTVNNVKNQLEEIPTKKTDAEEIREQVQELDTQELKAAMLADNGTEGIMDTLEKLENAAGGAAGVAVSDEVAAFEADKVSVVGANLNNAAAESEEPITLVLDKPKEEHVLDAQYDNSVAISFSMTLENVEDAENLAVPVKVTLPVPDSINPDFLVILHYKQNGEIEEISMPDLHIFKEDGVTYTSFVLDSFSDFVMTHEAESEVEGGTSDSGATWSLSTWGNLTIDGEGAIEGAPWADVAKDIYTVSIGAGVSGIDEGAFKDCANLTAFEVAEENEYYCTDEYGILISKGGDDGSTVLMAYPVAMEGDYYEVPDYVDTIGAYAFYNSNLNYIYLANVEVIGEYAFAGCTRMYNVDFPATVTEIKEYAFAYNNLYRIWFEGEAPVIAENAFDLVGAGSYVCMAYYPSTASTWTEDKLVGYGGDLYWNMSGYVSVENDAEQVDEKGNPVVTAGKSVKLTAEILPEEFAGPKVYWELLGENASLYASMKAKGNTATITAKDVSETNYVTVAAYSDEDIAPYYQVIKIVPKAKILTISERFDGEKDSQIVEADRVIKAGDPLPVKLEVTAVEPEGASTEVTWKSSNTKLAKIDPQTGLIEFVDGATGTVTFTATATDGSKTKATATYTVVEETNAKIEGIENGETIELVGGQSKTLNVINTVTDKAIKAKNIRWEVYSENADGEAYATISSKGKLTAKKVLMETEIFVQGDIMSGEEVIGSVHFSAIIYPAVTHVKIAADGEMNNGETIYYDWNDPNLAYGMYLTPVLYPTDVENADRQVEVDWSVKKYDKYCEFEKDGKELLINSDVSKKSGTVTFKATAQDGSKKSASVKVMFGAFADSITIDAAGQTELASGEKLTLSADVKGKGDNDVALTKPGVTWSLSKADKAYASISTDKKSGDAILKAKTVYAEKTVTVIATSKDGMVVAEYPVTIKPSDVSILTIQNATYGNVTKDTITLDLTVNDTVTLSAADYAEPAEALTGIEWSPAKDSKTADVTANEDGTFIVKMLKGGSVTVTAKEGKRKATVTIKAVEMVKGLEISEKKTNETELMVASGKSVNLQALPTNASASNKKVTWSLAKGDEAYATISSSGKLTAAKDLTTRKTVTVIATAQDGSGVKGELKVVVAPLAQGVYVASVDPNGAVIMSVDSNRMNRIISNTTYEWDMAAQYGDGTQMDKIYLDAAVFPFYGYGEDQNAIQAVEWKSSNKKVADFVYDEEGNMLYLECYKAGSVTITATAADGSKQKVSFKLNVVKKIQVMDLKDDKAVIEVNDTKRVQVKAGKSIDLSKLIEFVAPVDPSNKKLDWEILYGNGKPFASIDAKGKLSTKKLTADKYLVIEATATDGDEAKLRIVVDIYVD